MLLTMRLSGSIGDGEAINVAAVRQQIAVAPCFDRVLVEIETNGGSSQVAFEVYDLLRSLPCPVATVTRRQCFSGGLLIFLAGGLRCAAPNAELLLHQARLSRECLPEQVPTKQFHIYADSLARTDRRIIDLLADRTGYDRKAFETDQQNEDKMPIALALHAGVVHHVLGSRSACNSDWPATAKALAAERGLAIPDYLRTPNFLSACATSAEFPDLIK